MNKINLSLTSGEEVNTTVVHLNAAFEDRTLAIDFHAKIAALCRDATRTKVSRNAGDIPYAGRLLARA